MTICEADVDGLLNEHLPEFADEVRAHRSEWPDDPMLYPLIARLFDFVVEASVLRSKDVLRRAFATVELAIVEGSSGVRDCFAIQMLEPVANDPKHERYPNFEPFLGPASTREIQQMRQWWQRQKALDEAVQRANAKLGVAVFVLAGQNPPDARVIADVARWKQLPRTDRQAAYRTLRACWREICGSQKGSLTITGPRETGFAVLR